MRATRTGSLGVASDVIRLANPVFVLLAVGIPTGALIYAANFDSLAILNYVHIMTGALWTGIDLFMGFVLGPVLGGLTPEARAAVFKRLIPRMTFLMPTLAGVTITGGIQLADKMRFSLLGSPWLVASLVVVGVLTIQGFGILLPNEIRIFQQLLSESPDVGNISRLGMFNAKLGAVQGVLQLAVIFVMANIRFYVPGIAPGVPQPDSLRLGLTPTSHVGAFKTDSVFEIESVFLHLHSCPASRK